MLFADFIARQARMPSGPFGWLLARLWIAESARANQVAHRLVHRVRHPHPGQLARPMLPSQGDSIPPVRLDPLA